MAVFINTLESNFGNFSVVSNKDTNSTTKYFIFKFTGDSLDSLKKKENDIAGNHYRNVKFHKILE
jgi:hypothetical protein